MVTAVRPHARKKTRAVKKKLFAWSITTVGGGIVGLVGQGRRKGGEREREGRLLLLSLFLLFAAAGPGWGLFLLVCLQKKKTSVTGFEPATL
jgi:hypothetical protein